MKKQFNQIEYINEYKRENCIRINFQVNRKTEKDIAEILEQQTNRSGFIKECIREYLKKSK